VRASPRPVLAASRLARLSLNTEMKSKKFQFAALCGGPTGGLQNRTRELFDAPLPLGPSGVGRGRRPGLARTLLVVLAARAHSTHKPYRGGSTDGV
jgi:hypothetical protein